MTGVVLDVWSYSGLIKGFVQSNDLRAALDVLQEMKEANGVLPNEVCTSSVPLSFLSQACIYPKTLNELGPSAVLATIAWLSGLKMDASTLTHQCKTVDTMSCTSQCL